MALIYQNSGFVFMVKKNDIDGRLPQGFINVVIQKGRWLFSSLELASHFITVISNFIFIFHLRRSAMPG